MRAGLVFPLTKLRTHKRVRSSGAIPIRFGRRHHVTLSVTKRVCLIRPLSHQNAKQPTSNGEPALRNGAWCLGDGHVGLSGVRGPVYYPKTSTSHVIEITESDLIDARPPQSCWGR
jgi:hypothetical protein